MSSLTRIEIKAGTNIVGTAPSGQLDDDTDTLTATNVNFPKAIRYLKKTLNVSGTFTTNRSFEQAMVLTQWSGSYDSGTAIFGRK